MLGSCGKCKKVCKVYKDLDEDTNKLVCLSDCCYADVYHDEDLLNPITPEEDEL